MDEKERTLTLRQADAEQHIVDLEARAAQHAAEQAEWEQRRADFESRDAELRRGEEDLVQRRGELTAESKRLDAELQSRREELEHEQRTRIAELEEQARQQQMQLEQEHAQRTQEFEQRAAEIDEHARAVEAELAARRQEFELRTADRMAELEALDARQAELDQRGRELDERHTELESLRQEIDAQHQGIEQRAAELQEEIETFAADRQAFEQAAQEWSGLQEAAQTEQQTLAQLRTELSTRTDELAQRENTLDEQLQEIEKRSESATQLESELSARRGEIDELYRQAIETKERARGQLKQAERLKQQLLTREAELRRSALQVEVDRENMAQNQAALLAEHQKLAELQDEVQRDLDAMAEQDRLAEQTRIAMSRRRFGVAGLSLCLMAGITATAIWLHLDQPRYAVEAQLNIVTQRAAGPIVAAEHAAWLLSDGVAENLTEPQQRSAWQSALASGAVLVSPASDARSLNLRVQASQQAGLKNLVNQVIAGYQKFLRQKPLVADGTGERATLEARRAALEQQIQLLRTRQDALRQQDEDSPAATQNADPRGAFSTAVAEFEHVVDRLQAQQTELAELFEQPTPQGEVTTEALGQLIAEDTIYQQDYKEFTAEAEKYQTELAISMAVADRADAGSPKVGPRARRHARRAARSQPAALHSHRAGAEPHRNQRPLPAHFNVRRGLGHPADFDGTSGPHQRRSRTRSGADRGQRRGHQARWNCPQHATNRPGTRRRNEQRTRRQHTRPGRRQRPCVPIWRGCKKKLTAWRKPAAR